MPLYNIHQENTHGDNNVYILSLDIDVEWLRNIVFNDKDKIKVLLENFQQPKKSDFELKIMKNIDDKNQKNELVDFYKTFIQKYENEMQILFDFFKDEELIDEIDRASESIQMAVYALNDETKLNAKIFNNIIQEHTKSLQNDDKELMKLIIFMLYRYCFIGLV